MTDNRLVLDLLATVQPDEVALVYKTPEGDPLIVLMSREAVVIEPGTKFEVLRIG